MAHSAYLPLHPQRSRVYDQWRCIRWVSYLWLRTIIDITKYQKLPFLSAIPFLSVSSYTITQNIWRRHSRLLTIASSFLVNLSLTFWDGIVDYKHGEYEAQWKAIDRAFCDSKLARVTRVEIREYEQQTSQFVADWHTLFQEILLKSYKRGILWNSAADTESKSPHEPKIISFYVS